jgi:hypothetical protein
MLTLLLLPHLAWGQSFYYVFDGNSVSLIRQDPNQVSAPEWAAFYFKKGRSTDNPNSKWGSSTKKTPAEVLKSVEADQKFERQYEKWCGCSWGDYTFFNVLAPVAMRKSPTTLDPLKVNLLNKAHETWDKAQGLVERFTHLLIAWTRGDQSAFDKLSQAVYKNYATSSFNYHVQFWRDREDKVASGHFCYVLRLFTCLTQVSSTSKYDETSRRTLEKASLYDPAVVYVHIAPGRSTHF